jgi:hypothetical protein
MRFTQPKLIPSIFCFAVVGLTAAFLPHPKFQSPVEPLSISETEVINSDAQKQIKNVQETRESMRANWLNL